MSRISIVLRPAIVLSVAATVGLLATPAWCGGVHFGGPMFRPSFNPGATFRPSINPRVFSTPHAVYRPPTHPGVAVLPPPRTSSSQQPQISAAPLPVSPYGPGKYQLNPPGASVSPQGPSGTTGSGGSALAAASGLSNVCVTRSGSCPMQRTLGSPCQCKDAQGHLYEGTARYVVQ